MLVFGGSDALKGLLDGEIELERRMYSLNVPTQVSMLECLGAIRAHLHEVVAS